MTYQWQKEGIDIKGATSSIYSISVTVSSDAGRYSVIITNAAGSMSSDSATLTVNPVGVALAPAITTQPSTQSITAGNALTLYVAATGSPSLNYQWYKNDIAIIGASSSGLIFSSFQLSDLGSYSVLVSNALGTVKSDAAVLSLKPIPDLILKPLPTITTQPVSHNVAVGSSLIVFVYDSGSDQTTYQWMKQAPLTSQPTAIPGATSSRLTITNSSDYDAGSYYVIISTSSGSVTSAKAIITVNSPPNISLQPTPTVTYSGNNYTLSVDADVSTPLNYQWYKDGTAINGALSYSYTLSGPSRDKAGAYYVVISNIAGSVTSHATIVVTPPTITLAPASYSAVAGTIATFTVASNDTTSLTYQWYKNGSAISGATQASYSVYGATLSDAANYNVIVSNPYGSTTTPNVTLTVTPAPLAPTITTQPVSQSVTASFSASFYVNASGTSPFTYVWKKDGSAVVGSNSPNLTLSNTTAINSSTYTVTISNSAGTVTSNVVTLSINAPATVFAQRRFTSGSSNVLWSFAYGNATMVAVGSPGLLYTSIDGVNWTLRASGTNEALMGVAYGNNQFVAVGDNGRILRSFDGIQWSYAANVGTIFRLNGVIYAGDRWVAVGENGVIVTSSDANTWSPVLSGTTRFLRGLAYSEGCLIATGGAGTILSSSDSITWTSRFSGTTSDLDACAVVGNYFLSVGDAGECLFSYVKLGGAVWINNSKYKPTTTAHLRAIASGAGTAIVFSDIGTAYYLPSIYGFWSPLPLPTTTTFLGAGFALNRFYALGTGETILQSELFFTGRLSNLSTRGLTGLGSDVLISGLIITGTASKSMLIRAAGPALANFGISGILDKPILTLFDSKGTAIASNTGWNQSPNDSDIRSSSIAAGAFAFPENSADSALLIRLIPGSYTAQVTGVNKTTGTTLIETYDMESVQTMQSKLINISSRGVVGSGQNIIIPGISVGGSSSRILLIRAVGPTLGAFGVTGTLSNPTISVVQTVNGINTTLATNDDWESQNSTVTFTAAEVRELSTKAGAFTLPSGSKDAALLFSTSTNTSYTVLVSGANGETGVALVEVYDVTGL